MPRQTLAVSLLLTGTELLLCVDLSTDLAVFLMHIRVFCRETPEYAHVLEPLFSLTS